MLFRGCPLFRGFTKQHTLAVTYSVFPLCLYASIARRTDKTVPTIAIMVTIPPIPPPTA